MQRFVTQITNPVGHSASMSYDLKTGNKQSETDANGLTTTYNYDAFGNLTRINYPDGTQTNISIQWHTTSYPPNARYYTKTTSTGKPILEVYYDILGWEVCRLDDGNYIETEYNNKGQVKRISYPFNPTNAQEKFWHEYTYDNYGRKLTEEAPYTDLSYAYDKVNRKVTVTNNLRGNTFSSKTYDALGRVIHATDNGGSITYTYDITADKKHKTTIVANGATTTIESDLWGNRLSIKEPNAGEITSKYNGFNELIEQKDANNNITKYEYDKLGRVTQKQYITSGTIHRTLTYEYDNFTDTHKERGKLHQIKIGNMRSETFTYDNLSRLYQHTKVVSGAHYTHTYAYTATGQLDTLTYPSSFAVIYNYTPTGKLNEIRRSDDNSLIYKVNARNMYHAPTRCEYGNGVATHYTYDVHGLLTRIQTGNKIATIPIGDIERGKVINEQAYTLDSTILNYRYAYDTKGLMISRSESVLKRREAYEYDNLDRLTKIESGAIGQPGTMQELFYSDNGNIESNSNVGSYIYETKPHAVTEIVPVNHGVISASDCNVEYNYFNQPTQIIEGSYKLELSYDANQQRNRMTKIKGTATENVLFYINKYYEREMDYTTGTVRNYHYIYGDNGVVALYIANRHHSTDTIGDDLPDFSPDYTVAFTDSMYYIHTDHLGSYCAITNVNKQVKQRNYFDPWGNFRRIVRDRNGFGIDEVYQPDSLQIGTVPFMNFTLTSRGFTGHEHYSELKIINMNGRLYDPVIARFFSPDKYVANSSFTQDFNRYTYCRNNPLHYVDPSGQLFSLPHWQMYLFGIGGVSPTMLNTVTCSTTAPINFAGAFNTFMFNGMAQQNIGSGSNGAFSNPGRTRRMHNTHFKNTGMYQWDNNSSNAQYTPSPAQQAELASQAAFGSQMPVLGGGLPIRSNIFGEFKLEVSQTNGTFGTTYGGSAAFSGVTEGNFTNFLGHVEFGYNMAVDGSLRASPFAKGFGTTLTGLNIFVEGMQLHSQYKNTGRVNPVTAIGVGANFTGLLSKFMSKYALGGRVMPFIGRAAGFVGMAITTAESWWMIYQSMDNLRFSPLSLDRATGEPYWGDLEYYFKSFEERW
ncbi:MAG: hypothetical protein FWC34_11475 [Bacteroidetes bacterium]|nr:hypothetical protein [Bacteroidota bacterium]MCL2302204.1 hypothetical protein [Lentimicrobiaceae bacterium]MCL2302284.1 hypothetical protein [Lentimicrobiaceae bacterium]